MRMGIKKSIQKLLSLPVEMRYDEVNHILVSLGFRLKNISGSHFIYKNELLSKKIVIVNHSNKVKRSYLRQIILFIRPNGQS